MYHPDLHINEEIKRQYIESETFDLSVGYPPRWWMCDCGAMHNRGHYYNIGVHRCLSCGYIGDGGIMGDSKDELLNKPAG